ncbi:MAG TPA: DUF1801 domain-containing protein [Bryobacteraceae bacterium]|nr:DUF1801 domain-containing protein [Bryobacteraceae bacterium]
MTSTQQLAGFLAKFTPEIEVRATSILARMRRLLPCATELVYDNYNALAIGFGPGEKTSEAIFSIAVFPRWISLFFLQGAALADPAGILKGNGNVVRHIVLSGPGDLDSPAIAELMSRALASAPNPIVASAPARLIIKSVSPKQRPRRPSK